MIEPHGRKQLVDGRLTFGPKDFKEQLEAMPRLGIEPSYSHEAWNIATGVYTPLRGFMDMDEVETVADECFVPQGKKCVTWTLPVVLPIQPTGNKIREGWSYQLVEKTDPDKWGKLVGVVQTAYPWKPTKKWLRKTGKQIYGNIHNHPGYDEWLKLSRRTMIAGEISMFDPGYETAADPRRTRRIFESREWRTVTAFQIRNAPHRGHEYAMKAALNFTDGLFINPVLGPKKPGDFTDDAIMWANEMLVDQYMNQENVAFAPLHYTMRYAGPKEAIHHAIMRQNMGCSHIVIGRSHAEPGGAYGPYEAHEAFETIAGPDLKIQPIKLKAYHWCDLCEEITNEKTCPHPDQWRRQFSGTMIRKLISEGHTPPSWMMRREIAMHLIDQKEDIFVEKPKPKPRSEPSKKPMLAEVKK